MARWRVDYLGKKGSHLGTVEAPDEEAAIAEAAKQFNITPARRNKIAVTARRSQARSQRRPRPCAPTTEAFPPDTPGGPPHGAPGVGPTQRWGGWFSGSADVRWSRAGRA